MEQVAHAESATPVRARSFRSLDVVLERGGHVVARVPNFSIAPGQSVALVGPSGSGKTTALMSFALIHPPQSGLITVASNNPWTLKRSERDRYRGRHIGMIFQSFHLVDALSVEQNILLAARCARLPLDHERLDQLLARLSISQIRKKRADQISHGQAQRVAVARALFNRPDIILADEPTSALDDGNARAMLGLLIEAAATENAALLVTSHDRRILERMDHVHTMLRDAS